MDCSSRVARHQEIETTMREKVDILPLRGRSQELLNPEREKSETSQKRAGKKKPERKRATRKSKK
jgi:hypothetical protein